MLKAVCLQNWGDLVSFNQEMAKCESQGIVWILVFLDNTGFHGVDK